MKVKTVILITLLLYSQSTFALDEIAECISQQDENIKGFAIPKSLGKLLLATDHDESDFEMPCCGRWWEKDPRELYSASAVQLGGEGMDYLVMAKPAGPREFGHNNPVWIARSGKGGFKILLSASATSGTGIRVLSGVTNGFHDVCVKQTDSAATKTVKIFSYNFNNYNAARCFRLSYGAASDLPTVKIARCE